MNQFEKTMIIDSSRDEIQDWEKPHRIEMTDEEYLNQYNKPQIDTPTPKKENNASSKSKAPKKTAIKANRKSK